MSEATERLRHLVEHESARAGRSSGTESRAGGAGCEASLADRLATLDDLEERARDERAAEDLPVLDALADATRYRLVRLLAAADGELCTCEFAPLMAVSESAVSHALSTLVDAGLVARRKDGRWRYYRVTERASALLSALDVAHDAPGTGRADSARETATSEDGG